MSNNKNEQKCRSCGRELYQWRPGNLCVCGECFYWDRVPKEDYHNEEGLRYDEGKPRYDLIPPTIIEELAKVFNYGTIKYEEKNWEKGMKWGKVYRPALSHLLKFWKGESIDKESGCHHLIMAAWNCLALFIYEKHNLGTDDRSKL